MLPELSRCNMCVPKVLIHTPICVTSFSNYPYLNLKILKLYFCLLQIENMEHCDFVPLRNMLIRTYLQDLKEVTNNVLYENFRCRKLAGVAGTTMDKIPNKVTLD